MLSGLTPPNDRDDGILQPGTMLDNTMVTDLSATEETQALHALTMLVSSTGANAPWSYLLTHLPRGLVSYVILDVHSSRSVP